MLLNCGVGEDSWKSLGLQGDQTSQSKWNQSWTFIGRTDAEAEAPILWPSDAKSQLTRKERLKAEGEGDNRGWDGWMALPMQWTWVWVGSGSWWWTGRPGVLQVMGSQRVGHDWATELNYGAGKDSWESLKEIQPVHPGGNQPWIFIGRTDAEAEAPILWPSDA